MKILMLTPYVPYPLMSGGQIRTWNLVKGLRKKHEFTLVCFYREEKEKEYKEKLLEIFKEVYFIKKDKPWTLKSLIKSLGKYPLLMKTYDKPEAKKIIVELLRKNNYDLVHCEPFYIMQNLPDRLTVPVVLVEHNIEYLAYQRYVENQKILPVKAAMKADVAKLKSWEEKSWHLAKKVAAVSEDDRQIIALAGIKDAALVPNGVDLEYFTFSPKPASFDKTILFVGDFRWFPNLEAVKILKNRIWAKIKSAAEGKNLKLWIVGKYIPGEIKSWAGSDIMVTEKIPDIRDAYSQSDILLAPIYSGGGTKYKILEAMASGCPVVTTALGKEGLVVVDGKNIQIADTDEKIVESVMRILTDNNRSLEIARAARQVIEENYGWDKISEELDLFYRTIL